MLTLWDTARCEPHSERSEILPAATRYYNLIAVILLNLKPEHPWRPDEIPFSVQTVLLPCFSFVRLTLIGM